MFWLVFIFPGKPECFLPRETPPSRAVVLGMPACPRSAESWEAPPAPFRSSGRGGASPSSDLYARPGIGGLVLAVVGEGERGFPRHPCGN